MDCQVPSSNLRGRGICPQLLREGHNLKEKKAPKTDKSAPSFAGKEKELEDFMEDLTEEVAIAEDDSSDIEEIDDVPPPTQEKGQGLGLKLSFSAM